MPVWLRLVGPAVSAAELVRGSDRLGEAIWSRNVPIVRRQPYGRPTRFPSPLIKPDVPISGIRLSDRLHQRLTDAAPGEHRAVATRPKPRTQPCPRIWQRRAQPPCGGVAGSSARAHRRSDRPLDTL